MARSRSLKPAATAAPVTPADAEAAAFKYVPLDDLGKLDIADSLRLTIECLQTGRVIANLVTNPAEVIPARRHREERTAPVLNRLRRIVAEARTMPVTHVEALLLRCGQLTNEFLGRTPQDSDAAEFVGRMLSSPGLYDAIQVQKVPKGHVQGTPIPNVPLACIAKLQPPSSAAATSSVSAPESTGSSLGAGRRLGTAVTA